MLKIISERTPMEYITYHIEFTDDEGSGFSFNADVNGKIIIENEDQRKNYEYAIAHPELFPIQYNEFTKRVQHYTEPAHGICRCGQEITLQDEYMGACQCEKCGQWYNVFGQELIDPEYWSE